MKEQEHDTGSLGTAASGDAGRQPKPRRGSRGNLVNRDETLYDWISARLTRLSAARTLSGFSCEYSESPESDTGYPGVPRCYLSASDEADWCDNCRTRNRLYPGLQRLRANERMAFRRLCRSAERFKQSHDLHERRDEA